MFGFGIPWKLVIIVVASIAIAGVITAGVFHYNGLLAQITQLEKDKVQLETAVATQKDTIKSMKKTAEDIEKERDAALASEVTTRKELAEFEEQLRNREQYEREQRIEESRKASLYLKFLQEHEECVAEHFDDFTGKCNFRGQFVK
jgi:septal ring factor EnvC (AmiA/AmiB activator)